MFLSKLDLNPRCQRVRRELSNIYEVHRTIMRAFPDEVEGPGRVLFRIEGCREECVTVLVQSSKEPDWSKPVVPIDFFIHHPQTKVFDPVLIKGEQLIFRLTANPTVKRDGKRWGLVNEEELRGWMERKAAESGFSLLSLRVIPHRPVEGEKNDAGSALKFASVTYEGTLRIEDSERFHDALESGIGSGKGFGFGLLSIAQLR